MSRQGNGMRTQNSLVPAHLPHDFLPGRFGTETEIPQNTSRHPVTFQEQSQEDVFGSDASLFGDFGFRRGKPERFLNTRRVWNPIRHFARWKITDPILDLPSHALTIHSHFF